MNRRLKEESGQTLVEAIAAIAVAVVIITALVTLALSTQRAANTSRNQNQNTLYGEETLELVRNIRDNKLPGSIRGVTALTCNSTNSCTFSDLFGYTISATGGALYFSLNKDQIGGCNSGATTCSQLISVSDSTPQSIASTIYSRVIKISDSGSTLSTNTDPADRVKFIEATISWTDNAGDHKSITSTKLTNFK